MTTWNNVKTGDYIRNTTTGEVRRVYVAGNRQYMEVDIWLLPLKQFNPTDWELISRKNSEVETW